MGDVRRRGPKKKSNKNSRGVLEVTSRLLSTPRLTAKEGATRSIEHNLISPPNEKCLNEGVVCFCVCSVVYKLVC